MGASNFSFLTKNGSRAGFSYPKKTQGPPRDFWIGQPLVLESELGFFNRPHAFWSCANKMMSVLLSLADVHGDRGIRPHSLKVTTIDVLMVGIAKGKANLSQLAFQGNYRAFNAQDMGNVYSRNFAQRQISAPKFAREILTKIKMQSLSQSTYRYFRN